MVLLQNLKSMMVLLQNLKSMTLSRKDYVYVSGEKAS